MSSIRQLTAGTAIAALLAVPAFAAAQTPPSQPPAQQQPPSQPQPPAQPPQQQPPATQPPTQTPAQPAAPAAQGNEQAARRHLTEARNTLSELTQLPAASQLTGDTRTQVSQLISNFNELITTQSEWRASYAKVNANLTALIGPDPTAATDPAATGTSGAVGTTGSTASSLDPAIRAKLVEFRQKLSEFEKAASGAPATTPTTPPEDPPTTPPATATPPATTPPATGNPPATTPPATDPAATGTTGMQANAEVLRHIAAIEALLKTEDDSGGLTLTKAQLEQLRNHLALLRQSIDKK